MLWLLNVIGVKEAELNITVKCNKTQYLYQIFSVLQMFNLLFNLHHLRLLSLL